MKKNITKRTFIFLVSVVLVLGGMTIMAPLMAGAAGLAQEKKEVWTVTEAEIARQAAEGMQLKDIINKAVTSGERIHVVVAAAIKIGLDPSKVVYTTITEGYAPRTVVSAALKAGAPLAAVLRSAATAGMDKNPLPLGEIVTTALKSGNDPFLVVSTCIKEGYDAQSVVKAALKAGVPLNVVVKSAVDAGADDTAIYVGAADAGVSPRAVEIAISEARTPASVKAVSSPVPPPARMVDDDVRPFLIADQAPALFGRGGVILTPIPVLSPFHIQVGQLKVNPFLSVAETFSDNISYVPEDSKLSDSITTVTPGIRLQLPFRAHRAELEYYSIVTRYGKYRQANTSDHHIGAAVDFRPGERFELRLSDTFERGFEPLSSTPTGALEQFKTNRAALTAAYRPTDDARVQLDFGKSSWRFKTSEFRDREENQIAGVVFYRVLTATSVFIEYELKDIVYTQDALDLDSKIGTLQAGLTWEFSDHSKGTLKAGFARKSFAFSAMSDAAVKVGSADVRHDFTQGTTLVLTAQRSLNEPSLMDFPYFISSGVYGEMTHHFVRTFAAVVHGAYVKDGYFSRTDKTYLAGAGLKYQAKDWFEFAVDYNRRVRHSTTPANFYSENSFIVMVNISL